jgi:hypothetical protein
MLLWVVCCCLSLYRIGLLLLGKPLDRETTDQYRLIVTASDGNPGGVRIFYSVSKGATVHVPNLLYGELSLEQHKRNVRLFH